MDEPIITKSFLYTALAMLFMVIFTFAITNMAGVYVLGTLGGSTDTTSYTISFYGIGNALTLPLGERLGKRFGAKYILIFCLISFTLLTFVACFSMTFPIFNIIRLLQGCSSGPILITITGLLNRLITQEEKDLYIRNIVIIFISASMVGACLGGSIAYEYTWRIAFYLNAIIICILSFRLIYLIRDLPVKKTPLRIDYWGYLYYVVALLCLGSFVTLGQQLDWFRSERITALFFMGTIALIAFFVHSSRQEHPILHLALLKNRTVAFALFHVAILFSAYFGMVILLSLWLNIYVRYTANWISVVIGISAITAISVMSIVKKMHGKKSIFALFVAIIFLAISCFYTAGFDSEVDFLRIAISRIIAGIGLALFLPPLFHLILGSCNAEEGLQGVTLFQVTRTLSSGLGASIYSTLWLRRDVFFHERLGEQLTQYSLQTRDYLNALDPYNLSVCKKIDTLSEALARQSESLALNDSFYLMGWLMVALLVIVIVFHLKRSIVNQAHM